MQEGPFEKRWWYNHDIRENGNGQFSKKNTQHTSSPFHMTVACKQIVWQLCVFVHV